MVIKEALDHASTHIQVLEAREDQYTTSRFQEWRGLGHLQLQYLEEQVSEGSTQL